MSSSEEHAESHKLTSYNNLTDHSVILVVSLQISTSRPLSLAWSSLEGGVTHEPLVKTVSTLRDPLNLECSHILIGLEQSTQKGRVLALAARDND